MRIGWCIVMRNISFDNPYLLTVVIPLILLILIPVFISIRKDNKSVSVIVSVVLHVLIAVFVVLALVGTVLTTVMTETEIYIVADVSYSADRNLDLIDDYIASVTKDLPLNSKVGVVCFGKDHTLLTELGGEIVDVKQAQVDTGSTDIASALDYTATLFHEDVIKRVILITDGKQTGNDGTGKLISSIDQLYSKNIYLDAIYLDDNIPADVNEVQLSGVEFTESTYLGHGTTANVLIQSNRETDAILTLYRNAAVAETRAEHLTKGYNVINIDLTADVADVYDYRVEIAADADTSPYNNSYSFTQTVSDKLNLLMATASTDDVRAAQQLYAEDANVIVYYKNALHFAQFVNGECVLDLDIAAAAKEAYRADKSRPESEYREQLLQEAVDMYADAVNVTLTAYVTHPAVQRDIPCSVEELCQYDEIILSNVDVRDLTNYTAFIDGVDTVVSRFGKTLVTLGDTKIQNKDDDVLKQLEDMLPAKFGSSASDPKLYAIVIDVSRSMELVSRLNSAKEAAIQILNLLEEDDYVTVISFYGSVTPVQTPPIQVSERESLISLINSLQPIQGTCLGAGLKAALDIVKPFSNFSEKQVMLISDGKSSALEADDPVAIATEMFSEQIVLSVFDTYTAMEEHQELLREIASAGGGKYYRMEANASVEDLVLSEIADTLTGSVVEEPTDVYIERSSEAVLEGISSLPRLNGFVYAKAKAGAVTVLTGDFKKPNGTVIKAPIYTYWKYGNGKVVSLTTSVSGEWVGEWKNNSGEQFLRNMVDANLPTEHVDYPYTFEVDFDGTDSTIELIPATLNSDAVNAKVYVSVTMPNGQVLEEQLRFDSTRYFYSFETPETGSYAVRVTYVLNSGTENETAFTSNSYFNLSYSPEYDSFTVFDASNLHTALRGRGIVSEDGTLKIENDEKEIATYTISFTVPFMIVAIALYVIDVIIRKLKWSDIKSLFGRVVSERSK